MLRNSNGEWINEVDDIKNLACEYFKTLFDQEDHMRTPLQTECTFPLAEKNALNCLVNPIIEEEIRAAMFSMKGTKAPDSDGFPASFYQQYWAVVGENVKQVVLDAFKDRTESFKPSRGMRQCNPISPYVFMLCMEKLSHIIQDAIEDDRWKPLHVGRRGPPISHLLFADDVILFGEASLNQAHCMMECINLFCQASGQKVNPQKTQIYFSSNTDVSTRNSIAGFMNFNVSSNLGRYLGMPLMNDKNSKGNSSDILAKVSNRLAGWKRNCLSMAGRVTLAKAVISSIPYYAMQSSRIPKKVCEEIEKKQRNNFIWGHHDEAAGGLGIKRLAAMNDAFLMKLGWKLKVEPTNLCCQVLRGKYGRGWEWMRESQAHNYDSEMWRNIIGCGRVFRTNKPRVLGMGAQLIFGAYIIDYCDEMGQWNFSKMEEFLGDDDMRWLHSSLPPSNLNGADKICWGAKGKGNFSNKMAYDSIVHRVVAEDRWKKLWRIRAPKRVKIFVWKAMHNRLMTRSCCSKWGGSSPYCHRCIYVIEDQIHVLRDCRYAMNLWRNIVGSNSILPFL
ncbi:ribonuclease H [Senna tora]|uniref:Ribonuclease H n=1 Tax=Senna tora TaxID=362788 RepID=A0A834TQT2_9FABA|nr:ribonuclease H [Senna tora]